MSPIRIALAHGQHVLKSVKLPLKELGLRFYPSKATVKPVQQLKPVLSAKELAKPLLSQNVPLVHPK